MPNLNIDMLCTTQERVIFTVGIYKLPPLEIHVARRLSIKFYVDELYIIQTWKCLSLSETTHDKKTTLVCRFKSVNFPYNFTSPLKQLLSAGA
jgi:hypothetical protein